jgi:hypothetical protein
MRVQIDGDPFLHLWNTERWETRGIWPCNWITHAEPQTPPFATAYRCRFSLERGAVVRIHVSADERYELFLDGKRIGRGPERSDTRNWRFETYDLPLDAGAHTLVARVWALGDVAPVAQMSAAPGFLLAPQDEQFTPLIGTGAAPWESLALDGYSFKLAARPMTYFAIGPEFRVDGAQFPWGFERGDGEGWTPARVGAKAVGLLRAEYSPYRLLVPARLPPMLDQPRSAGRVRFVGASLGEATPLRAAENMPDELPAWQGVIDGGQPLTVPANTTRRVLIDLEIYTCAYPELTVSGGAGSELRLNWVEALYNEPEAKTKGQRNAVEEKYVIGVVDTWLPDGGESRAFDTLWWRCGQYVEVSVRTGAEPLTIERLGLRETRYPLEPDMRFEADHPGIADVVRIAVRSLQMCAHETYMDCPYYEQLMYVGDTRLQALVTYTITHDDRLPRAALHQFDQSRLPFGLTQSRYPSRVTQIIPPFALWWVAMVHDFARWRDDAALVRSLLPGVRSVLDGFGAFMNEDGLIQAPRGWNFMDWAIEWRSGVPPEGGLGVSGPVNWLYAYALTLAAQLEEWHGDPELAARARRHASGLAERIDAAFWDEARGLYADDLAHQHYSEHSQCLALLSGLASNRRDALKHGLLQDGTLTRTTIYFSHYLFETYTLLGRMDALFERLGMWFELANQGFTTTPEQPEPSRSDCHAWGAHPLYHFFGSVLGIQPSAPGFRSVTIAPQLGPLQWAKGELPHPQGVIAVNIRHENGNLTGSVTLPQGIEGTLVWGGRELPLHGGAQNIELVES